MTALDNARAALARADDWARPIVPTEASELLDFVSNAMEALIAEYERLTAAPTDDEREALARQFHEAYERLAPSFGYETRKASAVPWERVPEPNKRLMVAVAGEVLAGFRRQGPITDDERAALAEFIDARFDDYKPVYSKEGSAVSSNLADAILAAGYRRQGPPTDDERDALAKAMCAIEVRSRSASLEEVQEGIQRWTRHRYEAERLLEELADYGYALRRQGLVTDDEREALAQALFRTLYDAGATFTSNDLIPRLTATVRAAGFRRQGPPTDAQVEAAAKALFDASQELDQDNSWDDPLPDEWRQAWRDAARDALEAAREAY